MLGFDQCWISGSLSSESDELFVWESRPKLEEYYFDLASLTKVLLTSALLVDHKLRLQESWSCFLSRRIDEQIVELQNTPLSDLTLEELWEHRSGLDAHFLVFSGRRGVSSSRIETQKFVVQEILKRHTPLKKSFARKEVLYSDLGFLLLGIYLERFYQRSLKDLFDDFKSKLSVSHLKIKFGNELSDHDLVVACEKRHPLAEVNDDNSAAMGGVSGHAGLFATPGDLFAYLKALYRWAHDSEQSKAWFFAEGPHRFYKGWDRPSFKSDSLAGNLAPQKCIGHLGYTGTSLWIDPVSERGAIHLSNRIFPNDSDESKSHIKKLRQKFFTSYWQGTIEETCLKETT